jgi:adenylate cyclase class 2
MSNRGQETEAKFYVSNLEKIKTRLDELKARLNQPRVRETNLRFDLPDGSLRAQKRVLRLRHDTESKLTYKGAGQNTNGVIDREEIEFVVEDFEQARKFLEALGYQKSLSYEKYRTTYQVNDTSIMLDELPYGDFVEIEGEADDRIRELAGKLGLNWNAAINNSYTGLFESVRNALKLSFPDLSFENFEGLHVTAEHLGVHAADD